MYFLVYPHVTSSLALAYKVKFFFLFFFLLCFQHLEKLAQHISTNLPGIKGKMES